MAYRKKSALNAPKIDKAETPEPVVSAFSLGDIDDELNRIAELQGDVLSATERAEKALTALVLALDNITEKAVEQRADVLQLIG